MHCNWILFPLLLILVMIASLTFPSAFFSWQKPTIHLLCDIHILLCTACICWQSPLHIPLCDPNDSIVMNCSLMCLLIFYFLIEFRSQNPNGMSMMDGTDSDVLCCLTLCVLIFIGQSTYWSAQKWYRGIYFRTMRIPSQPWRKCGITVSCHGAFKNVW